MTVVSRLFNYDEFTGIKTTIHTDMTTEKTWFTYDGEVQDHLDYAAESRANNDLKRSGDMWHAAHIPPAVINKWLIEEGLDIFNPAHKDRLRKKLNDGDNLYLRTNEFRL